MLDNLVNANLPGLVGTINYSYDSYAQVLPEVLMAGMGLAIIIGFFCVVLNLVKGTKSKQYRELMSDMFVVGRIKQLATEYKIDIDKEIQDFNIREKRAKLQEKSLDYVIEGELKEKVADVDTNKKK